MKRITQVSLCIFIISFLVRIVIITFTPQSNSYADISCLVNGGQMISHNINPYDFNDNVELREKLRLDPFGDNNWLCSYQEIWNYHSANNLPFNLLFNGLLDYFFDGNVYYYRYTYAFLDSCIGYLTALFIFQLIQLPINFTSVLFVLLISSFSPALLLNGTFIPEDKGFQVLLILLSLWFSIYRKLFWACFFLSLAVGFKAIGAIVAPICLVYYVLTKEKFLRITEWQNLLRELFSTQTRIRQAIYFTLLTTVLFLVIYLPYASDFSRIMSQRLLYDIENVPDHSSIWVIFYDFFPDNWNIIRTTVLSLLTFLLVISFIKNLIPLDIFLLSVLILFLCCALVTGSLDRNNMAMQSVIVYMALRWKKESWVLGWYYGLGGMLLFVPVAYRQLVDNSLNYAYYSSYFVLGFCIVFFYIVFRRALHAWVLKRGVVA